MATDARGASPMIACTAAGPPKPSRVVALGSHRWALPVQLGNSVLCVQARALKLACTRRVSAGERLNLDGGAKPLVADDCGYLPLEPDAVHLTGSQLPAQLGEQSRTT